MSRSTLESARLSGASLSNPTGSDASHSDSSFSLFSKPSRTSPPQTSSTPPPTSSLPRVALLLLLTTLLSLYLLPTPRRAAAHDADPKAGAHFSYTGSGFRLDSPPPGGFPSDYDLFEASGLELLAWLPLPEMDADATTGNDCWGYLSPLGREYAIFGHSHGTTFVEVTNACDPIVVGNFAGPVSVWRDMKVYGATAYAVSEGGAGIQVFDLSQIDGGIVTPLGSVLTGGIADSHNVAIDETAGFLYRCGGGPNSGLRIYDLLNPQQPTFVAEWNDRYVHDAQIHSYTSGPYAGRQIAFCCSGFNGGFVETGIDILDVTDKQNILQLARYAYPGNQYSHQAWLSADGTRLYLNDEFDETDLNLPTTTQVIDVSDLQNPVQLTTFTNGNSAIGHNLYVSGNLVYEANYTSGLRVFDVSNPLVTSEIAFFDTFPEDDAAAYDGLWSVYPFLPSGTIVASDMNRGLFLFRLGEAPLQLAFPDGQPATIPPASGAPLLVEAIEAPGADFASGFVTIESGPTLGATLPLQPVSGLLLETSLPGGDCGSQLAYSITLTSVTGQQTRFPSANLDEHYLVSLTDLGIPLQLEDLENVVVSDWLVGSPSDSATTGIWELGTPNSTSLQTGADHTPSGEICWFTGQAAVGAPDGTNDVDTGSTTLTTPPFDIATLDDPYIGYWRWFATNPSDDSMIVEISSNGGSSWTTLEIVGPSPLETSPGWVFTQFRVANYVDLSTAIRLRFIVADNNPQSLVEAAIDDISLSTPVCEDCNGNGLDDAGEIAAGDVSDCNSNGVPDSCDIALGLEDLNQNGQLDICECEQFLRGDADNSGALSLADALRILNYLFLGGAAPVPNEAGDVDANGSTSLNDALALLTFLFSNGAPPAPPYPELGCSLP